MKTQMLSAAVVGARNNARELGDTAFEIVERKRDASSRDAGKRFFGVRGNVSFHEYFCCPSAEKAMARREQLLEALGL